MAGSKRLAQKLADHYSRHGQEQLLVTLYVDEAVLYGQVQPETAAALTQTLMDLRAARLKQRPALSQDGLTWCWILKRTRLAKKKGDWAQQFMNAAVQVLWCHCAHLLSEGDVAYNDQQESDYNTLEAFEKLLDESKTEEA